MCAGRQIRKCPCGMMGWEDLSNEEKEREFKRKEEEGWEHLGSLLIKRPQIKIPGLNC